MLLTSLVTDLKYAYYCYKLSSLVLFGVSLIHLTTTISQSDRTRRIIRFKYLLLTWSLSRHKQRCQFGYSCVLITVSYNNVVNVNTPVLSLSIVLVLR